MSEFSANQVTVKREST